MALEVRLDRRLDLLDAPDDALDLRPRREVEERDPGAGSGGVAGARDLREIAIGNQAEHHGVEGSMWLPKAPASVMRSTASTPARSISSLAPA